MADTTIDIMTPQVGEGANPDRYGPPLATATTIVDGQLVGVDASGNAVSGSFTATTKIIGVSDKQVSNVSPLPATAKYSTFSSVRTGRFAFVCGTGADAITNTNRKASCYAIDNQTIGLTDGGGTRPYVGIIEDVPTSGPAYGKVVVTVGVANPWTVSDPGAMPATFKARAVALVGDLAAYTGTGTGVLTGAANGVIHAVDGLTLAVGNVIVLPTGTTNLTAADAGPWQVTSIGAAGAKYVLTRPSWWAHGATIAEGQGVDIGGEGATFGLTTWKTNVQTAAKVVDTDDPDMYPTCVTLSLVLVAGTVTTALVPIRSATKSGVAITRTTANTSTATTGGYHVTTITPGAYGTASLIVQAAVAAGTINNADISTLAVTVTN